MLFSSKAARLLRRAADAVVAKSSVNQSPPTMCESLEQRRLFAWTSISVSGSNWSPSSTGLQDETATATVSSLPAHSHILPWFNLYATGDGNSPDVPTVTSQLAGQGLSVTNHWWVPSGWGEWTGGSTVPHSGASATLSITGEGFEDANSTWDITHWGVSVFQPKVNITGGGMAAENGGPLVFTVTRDGNSTVWDQDLVVQLDWSGSDPELTSSDFQEGLPSTVTIEEGQPSAQITLTPNDDTEPEEMENFVITLASSPQYAFANPASAPAAGGQIQDNDPDKWVKIVAMQSDASEKNRRPATFRLNRYGDDIALGVDLMVRYKLSGSAKPGVNIGQITPGDADFGNAFPLEGEENVYSVVIPVGEAFVDLVFTPVNDWRNGEGTETINVELLKDPDGLYGTKAGEKKADASIKDLTVTSVERLPPEEFPGTPTEQQLNDLVDLLSDVNAAVRAAAYADLLLAAHTNPVLESYFVSKHQQSQGQFPPEVEQRLASILSTAYPILTVQKVGDQIRVTTRATGGNISSMALGFKQFPTVAVDLVFWLDSLSNQLSPSLLGPLDGPYPFYVVPKSTGEDIIAVKCTVDNEQIIQVKIVVEESA